MTKIHIILCTAVLLLAANGFAQGRKHSLFLRGGLLGAETAVSTASRPDIDQEYVWFSDRPVAQFDAGANTVRWTFADRLATPLLQTDAAGAIRWRAEHEPYGAVSRLRDGAALRQPLRFPGQLADETTGDRHTNFHRWYRPGWSRFTQADPLMYEGVNATGATDGYLYVDGQPTRFTDPTGLIKWDPSCDACKPPANLDPIRRQQFEAETDALCAELDWWITDKNLAECMKRRCRETRVKCSGNCAYSDEVGGIPGAWAASGGVRHFQGRTVTICTNGSNGPASPGFSGVGLLHEFAHNCGWDHGDGKGVPDLYKTTYPEEAQKLGFH